MAKPRDSLALQAMRAVMAKGFTDEATLVSAGADVIGGGAGAEAQAQRIWDKHFKVFAPS